MFIDWSITGTTQKKKIITWIMLLSIAVVLVFGAQIAFVAKNTYRKAQIDTKRSTLQEQQDQVMKIKKTIAELQKENINTSLQRRNGMYRGLDKQKLISGIYNKMNGLDDLDAWDNLRKKNKDIEYSAFSIASTPVSNLYAEKIFNKYISKYIFLPSQIKKITFDGNNVIVSFNADYEYVAYRILSMIQNLLPGYVVIKSFSIQPVKQDIKTLLYDMKFYKKDINASLDNRLSCQIELDWYFIRNTKGYENIKDENIMITKGKEVNEIK